MAFDPDAYLSGDSVTKKKSKKSSFDPDVYLGDVAVPSAVESPKKESGASILASKPMGKLTSGFLGTSIQDAAKPQIESLSLEDMAKNLPDIPDGIMAVEPEKAKEIFSTYENAGKDPGFEVVTYMTPQGPKDTVKRKTYLSGYKPLSPEKQREVNEILDQERKKSVQSRTSLFDQTMEGLTRPTEELLSGAATLITGDPKYMEMIGAGRETIPFEDLSPTQKTAYSAAAMLGYTGPGHLLNLATKGLVKVGLSATGKEAAAKTAQKAVTKYVGKTVAKSVPTDLGKQVIGSLAGKTIKNAPTLALEGAAWEGIASGGDPERAIEGAVMFALGGPVAETAIGAAAKPIRKALSKIDPVVIDVVAKRAPDDIFIRPSELTDEAHRKVKQVEGIRLSSLYESQRDFAQAKLKVSLEKNENRLAQKSQMIKKLEKTRDELLAKISKNSNIEVTYREPKSFDDILKFGDRDLSYVAKELLEDKFGSLDGFKLAAEQEGNDYLSILVKSGFNQEQAAQINKRLTSFDPIIHRVTPTKKYIAKVSNTKLNQVNRVLKKLNKEEHALSVKVATVKKNSVYNPEAKASLLKNMTKDRYAAEIFQRKALEQGIDITGSDISKAYNFKKWITYTDRHSMVEAQTGIPMSQVTMDLIEAEYKKSHILKASEEFKIADRLADLRKIGVEGKQAWEWFHYIRTDKATGQVKWDPSELKMGAYTVPEFKGDAPSQKVIDVLSEFRRMTDWQHDVLTKSGQKVGYTPGYVAIKPKVGFFTSTSKIPDQTPGQARLLQKRSVGLIPEKERHLYHTDFYDLVPRMNRDFANAATFSPIVDKINTVDWMLRASGQKTRADDFLKYASRAMGHRNINETIQVLSLDLVNKNEPLLRKLSDLSGGENTLFQDAKSALYEMMYNSYIGLAPSSLIKQFFQPELVGSAEIGLKNIAFGKVGAFSPTNRKETKAALERVKDRLYPENVDYSMMGETQRQWMKTLVNIMNIPSKPGMKVFTTIDNKNREVVFLGASRQFKQAAKKGPQELSSILSDLLPAERTRVLEAYNKHGSQGAMDTYGLIRSKRTNYAYTLSEKAEVFSEGLGSVVPFVNWGVNQWTRHLQSVQLASKGKVIPLAAQIAYGVGGTIAVQQILNEKFYPTVLDTGVGKLSVSSGVPQSAILGFGEIDPFTALKGLTSGEVVSWVRYYKKVDGDILNPAKLFQTTPKQKRQRRLKGDLSDVIEFKPKKD